MAETNYQVPNNIANGDTPDATKLMGNFEYIENALNDFNGENVNDGTITDAKMATNPTTIRDEVMDDFVVSGLTSADPGATLTGVIAAGIAYIEGVRVSVNSYSNAYTASKDCYVDLDKNGEFHVTEVANSAAEPAVYANSLRIAKFVTNGSEITSYADMRPLYTDWAAYTPVVGGVTASSASGRYKQSGKTIEFVASATFSGTSSTTISFTLPKTNKTVSYVTVFGNDLNTKYYTGIGRISGGSVTFFGNDTTANWGASIPFAWNTGDNITVSGTYEAI